ncbi:Transcriptional regulator, GntR family [Azospirillum argentinense]|uniref:FadR/GntR family transcriptional regulator n=1 Tax=Azospirillum argentinense TaxID=2970906 RepID=UPI0032DF17D4
MESRERGLEDGASPMPGDGEGHAAARGRHTPLVQRVYQLLLTQISAGDYQPNERLPGENELATRFQVSRPIVREALRRLRDEGMIYSRQGAGSFVRATVEESRPLLGYAPVETIADIQRCYEFRLTIEPDHAYHAALRRNDAALSNIVSALDLMADATRAHRHRDDADFAFHAAIADAANNHYYASSMQALKDHIAVGMKFHGSSLLGPSGGLSHVLEEHRGIFEAIRNRDADTARARMRRHLEGSRDRVFEGRVLDLSL